MLEHFCECYSDLSGPILCPVLGSITPLFIPNSRIRPIRLIGLCSYYFFVSPCSSDTIRSFYGQISICGKPSMASLWKHQFLFGYRRYLFILRDIDHISDPYLHFSGLVWYEKLWERVYYSISNLWISNDRRVLHAGSSTILCFFRKRANPYVVRSWASSIRWDKAFPLQGPCAVNPLRAVVRRRKVVPAKLSGRGVVLCVSIAFLVEPAQPN